MLGPGHAAMERPLGPSAYWGEEKIWTAHFNNHNAMLDEKGRVWMTAAFRDEKNQPAFCKRIPTIRRPSCPLDRERSRMLTVYDPKTQKSEFVDTCFTTHHLNFAYDANNTLWTSSGGGGGVVGWVNIKMWDETHDPAQVAGLDALIVDTSGDGKRGEYTEPGKPADPGKDMRHRPGVLRRDGEPERRHGLGHDPHQSRLDRAHRSGLEPARDRALGNLQCPDAGLRSARRRHRQQGRCLGFARLAAISAASTAPSARARSTVRPRRATTARKAGRSTSIRARASKGIGDNSAESSYYSWVDQHNTLGLGKDVPVSTANLMDGLAALGKDGKMVSLRVPYPMGFFAKGLDGRIDDPNAGWKGRGLWTSSGDRAPWQYEGGKGMKPMAVHFQMRPDPLAH